MTSRANKVLRRIRLAIPVHLFKLLCHVQIPCLEVIHAPKDPIAALIVMRTDRAIHTSFHEVSQFSWSVWRNLTYTALMDHDVRVWAEVAAGQLASNVLHDILREMLPTLVLPDDLLAFR